jgi:hypothetical protein
MDAIIAVISYAWEGILVVLALIMMASVFFVRPSHFAPKPPKTDSREDTNA